MHSRNKRIRNGATIQRALGYTMARDPKKETVSVASSRVRQHIEDTLLAGGFSSRSQKHNYITTTYFFCRTQAIGKAVIPETHCPGIIGFYDKTLPKHGERGHENTQCYSAQNSDHGFNPSAQEHPATLPMPSFSTLHAHTPTFPHIYRRYRG